MDIVEVGGGTVRVACIHVGPTVRVESCREYRGSVERGVRGAEVRPWRVEQDVLVLHVRRERVEVAVLGYRSTLAVGLDPRSSRCKPDTVLQHVVGRRSEAVADAGVEGVDQRHRFLVARGIGQSQGMPGPAEVSHCAAVCHLGSGHRFVSIEVHPVGAAAVHGIGVEPRHQRAAGISHPLVGLVIVGVEDHDRRAGYGVAIG